MDTMGHIPGLPGLFVVCVFSGALSTLSSGYNALATVTWDDFFKVNIILMWIVRTVSYRLSFDNFD